MHTSLRHTHVLEKAGEGGEWRGNLASSNGQKKEGTKQNALEKNKMHVLKFKKTDVKRNERHSYEHLFILAPDPLLEDFQY